MEELGPVSNSGPTTSPDALARCISIDLEVSKKTNVVHALAGVRADTGQSVARSDLDRDLHAVLAEPDELAERAEFVLGHNLIKFDLPRLRKKRPSLRLLQLPVIDTLWLSPLAFPQHPYHRLVKHYKDGGLNRQKPNDPELDARLTLKVFSDQQKQLLATPPHLLTAWHWLTTNSGEAGKSSSPNSPSSPAGNIINDYLRRLPETPRSPRIGAPRRRSEADSPSSGCHQHLSRVLSQRSSAGQMRA